MTERANKLGKSKRTLSLSKSKKKSSIKDGASCTTTPITSFFSSQPPPKLACPLCGHLVPRFKINEHIDLQCQNFERTDAVSSSGSNNVPSAQLTPRENTPRSAKLPQNKDEDEVKEQTSPYFKNDKTVMNDLKKTSQETSNKTVVRVLDLGSLSAKISRKRQINPDAQKAANHAVERHEKELYPDSLNSSQKENLLLRREDTKDGVTVTEVSAAPEIRTDSETGHDPDHTASGSIEKSVSPNQKSSSSTLVKRKQTYSSKMTRSRKKAKYDSKETKEAKCPDSTKDPADQKQPETREPGTIAPHNPPVTSVSDTDAERDDRDSPHVSGVESCPADPEVKVSLPTRLPYYLQNFCSVLRAVLENEDDRALFDQHDMSHVQAFEKLSGMLRYNVCSGLTGDKVKTSVVCLPFQSDGTEAIRETLSEEAEMAASQQTGL